MNTTTPTINDYIYRVLTTKYKKDDPEAFKLVENMGYEIYKYDGTFGVKNPETGAHVRISDPYKRYKSLIGIGRAYAKKRTDITTFRNVDFERALSDPNKEKRNARREVETREWNRLNWGNPKTEKFKSAKHDVDYHTKSIQEAKERLENVIQSAIKSYESDFAYHTKERERAEKELANLREEYGLTNTHKKGA